LGGGETRDENCFNVDICPGESTDAVADLDHDFPFKDDCVPFIRIHHVLEHMKDRMHFLKEANRVLLPHGKMFVIVPHKSTSAAHHLDHLSYFSYKTLHQDGFDEQFVQRMAGKWRVNHSRLRLIAGKDRFIDKLINLFPGLYDLFFPCSEIVVEMEKVQ